MFRNPLAEFTYYRTYSRFRDTDHRRENWPETVQRYVDYMRTKLGDKLTEKEYEDVRRAIEEMRVMPSMRLMWAAGEMADVTNMAGYNCAFVAPKQISDFAEILFVLMAGTGVGFSVEEKTVSQLPEVAWQDGVVNQHEVGDSREGWADALDFGLCAWFAGEDVEFDYSKVRPAGARLKRMGGRASGPGPLRELLEFARGKVLDRQGDRLRPIDVHDIICMIGSTIVAGGVRRSALISLSDLDDKDMRDAKVGRFWVDEPQRSLANNSAVYEVKPTRSEFLAEWKALRESGTGERGIFNRSSLKAQFPARREYEGHVWGGNPCGEIYLRSKELCNLTEIVARAEDTIDDLLEKARIATILGTYQSTLTDFPYVSDEWRKNCEEERLLGVSITGMWDCETVRDPAVLKEMRFMCKATNEHYAKRFSINPSAAITCVKPSGTVSQLVDSASGMHPRHAAFYIRRIRINATDPLFKSFVSQGARYFPEVGQDPVTATTYVFEFPVKAPAGAVTKDEITSLEQLEFWKNVKLNYTEHNPSVTVSIGEDEWDEVAEWLWKNWEHVGGLSFLPRTDHVYEMAPYQEITEEKYNEMLADIPTLDLDMLHELETTDQTEGSKELACTGGACLI